MFPSQPCCNNTSKSNSYGGAKRNGGIPYTHHLRSFFYRIKTRDHSAATRGIPGFTNADKSTGYEKLDIVTGKGAKGCGNAPEDGHQADGLGTAPPVNKKGNRKCKDHNCPVNSRNKHTTLSMGYAPFAFNGSKH